MALCIMQSPVFLLSLFVILSLWQKARFESYRCFTVIALWVSPVILELVILEKVSHYSIAQVVFTVSTCVVLFMTFKKKRCRATPCANYEWLYGFHILSVISGLPGAFLTDLGLISLFYGASLAVLSRDIAEFVIDRSERNSCFPTDVESSALELNDNFIRISARDSLAAEGNCTSSKAQYTLECSHSFHGSCIRGWCIAGRKRTCPLCDTEFDRKKLLGSFWNCIYLMYHFFLDCCRVLLAFVCFFLICLILDEFLKQVAIPWIMENKDFLV